MSTEDARYEVGLDRDVVRRLDETLAKVRTEVLRARFKHAPMKSPHEGWAVLYEEVDELWDEVKADRGRAVTGLTEAVQVAAMGVRYHMDMQEPKN